MATTESLQLADAFRALVRMRTRLAPDQLSCPRAGDHAPCIARDGRLAVADGRPSDVCVGCDQPVARLHADEQTKATGP